MMAPPTSRRGAWPAADSGTARTAPANAAAARITFSAQAAGRTGRRQLRPAAADAAKTSEYASITHSGSSPAPALTTCWYARWATATTSTNARSGPRSRRPCCPDHPPARASAASWPDPREICAREPCSASEIGAVLSSRRGRAPPSTPLAAAPPLVAKETGGIRPRPCFYRSNLYFDHRTVMTPNRGSRPKHGPARRERLSRVSRSWRRRPETPHRRPGRPVLVSSTS